MRPQNEPSARRRGWGGSPESGANIVTDGALRANSPFQAGPAPSRLCVATVAVPAALFALAAAQGNHWSPFLLAAPLAWLAYDLSRGPNLAAARRLVGIGLVAGLAGLVLAASLASGWVLLAALLCIPMIAAGTAHSLRVQPAAREPGFSTDPRSVHFAMAVDLGLAAFWEAGALSRSWIDVRRIVADLESAVGHYRSKGWLDRPDAALEAPPPLEKIEIARRTVAGERVEALRFESEFEPFDEVVRARFFAHRRNRDSHALLWRHGGSWRPVLISIHGYGMGRAAIDLPWLRRRGWDMAGLHRDLGIDVVYFVLPLHGPRADGVRSARGFVDEHPLLTTAAVSQAIWDLRRLVGWLRAQGATAIGLQGISLGGYVASLFAALDPALTVVMPTVPAVDLVPSVCGQVPQFQRDRWQRDGFEVDLLSRAWSLHSPLAHRVRVPRAGRLLVAGFADRITPPPQVRALWEHWDQPELHWYPGSHLVWRGREPLQRRFADHLREHLRGGGAGGPGLSHFRSGPRGRGESGVR